MNVMERLRNRHNSFRSERPVVLGFLGDSVTHGCFEVFINEAGKVDTACEASSAYPALVAHELGRMFPFAQPAVIDAGVSGDNAAGGHSRLARDVLFARPDLVFVNFGLNDSMNPDVEDGLRRAIDAAWTTGNSDRQYAMFGNTIDARRGKPTTAALLATAAELLRQEVE